MCPLVSRAFSLMRPRGGRTVGYWANGTIQGGGSNTTRVIPRDAVGGGEEGEWNHLFSSGNGKTVGKAPPFPYIKASFEGVSGRWRRTYETRTQRPRGWGLLSVPGSPAGKEYPTGCQRVGALCKTHIHPIHTRAQLTGLP